jgi:hypothetical protein
MRSLIWKELRENIKWVPVPGLVILLVFLIEKPGQPMLDRTDAYFFCLTAVVFGLALGFLQVIFEAQGDKRAVLMHRPLAPSRIFAAKALAGMTVYVLALGIPFVCVESWFATPGNIVTPYDWRTSLPWLADILSGVVYYFAGMLIAQREARWYGSRGLALATGFFCSYLVWALPEFWQALVAIGMFVLLLAVAAWGSFCTGGAYPPLPRLAKGALGASLFLGLVILSMMGKQLAGEWSDPGMHYQVDIGRRGQLLYSTHEEGRGEIAINDVDGRPADLKGERSWRANLTLLDVPVHWGYRHNARFYVECANDTKPAGERWFFDHAQGRLLGYDAYYHHSLGSFGPEGFTPAGRQPVDRFPNQLLFITNRSQYITTEYLAFPDGVYLVDFVGRSIRRFFTPASGEKVRAVRWWRDDESNRSLVVVTTNQSVHIATEDGQRLVSMPWVLSADKYGPVFVGTLEKPHRYFVWYHLRLWLREPEEYQSEPSYLFEYDAQGRELAHRAVPPFPYPASPYAQSLYGVVTSLTEVATLLGTSQYVRSLARSNGSTRKYALIDYLEGIQYYVPGTATMATTLSPATQPPRGLIVGYVALILLSASASALVAVVLARRHAFSPFRCLGWALLCFLFGWIGLVLMLTLLEWSGRIPCPKCNRLRVVTRDTCEHCGALQAAPTRDGTEVFESAATAPPAALSVS